MVAPGFVAFNTTLMLFTNKVVCLDTLIYIFLRCHKSITDALTLFFSAMKLAPNVEVCTKVWILMTMLWELILPQKQNGDKNTSDLVVTMAGIHKHMGVQFIK